MGVNQNPFLESGPYYLLGGADRAGLVWPEGDDEGEAMGSTDLFYQLTCRKVLSTLPSSSHGVSTKDARVWSQSPGFESQLPLSPLTSSLNSNT